MAEAADHFLTSLFVHNAFAVRDLEIPIAQDGQRRHLILTGPNGSGKSSILAGVDAALRMYPTSVVSALQGSRQLIQRFEADLANNPAEEQRRKLEHARVLQLTQLQQFEAKVAVEIRAPAAVFDATETLLTYMPASRSLKLHRPTGPARIDEQRFLRAQGASALLLQFLVNLRMEQALAREDGQNEVADRIGERFKEIERRSREILDDDRAHLRFDRASYDFRIELGDGRLVDFDKLPDGVASILFMWASLMIPAEAILRTGVTDPAGWAVIDEPELHLHARLQELVLPFLTTMFPNVQLIVATHSPEVIASIPDATVFDLRSREAVSSREFQGIRYGTILTEHFGIESDFDVQTTRALRQLKTLVDEDPRPGTARYAEMRDLVAELADRPHLLVAQARKRIEFGDV